DPQPGPRRVEEIEHGEEVAPGVLLATARTSVRGRGVRFAESGMSEFLDEPTVLITLEHGPAAIADALTQVGSRLQCDAFVFIDVGGDVLALGGEPGLRSPLSDAIMLAVAARLGSAGQPVLGGVFGIGCDGELSPAEVLAGLGDLAAAGGLCGARGLTDYTAHQLEEAIRLVPTEASAQAVAAFRSSAGAAAIRGGARQIQRTAAAMVTFYFDVQLAFEKRGRLAQAVAQADGLEAANQALAGLGVRTELDLEREAAQLAAS
ncbi:MAG TPA: DUF1152 domain-containing protein, partial [Solirubrobacteraceae bacterium]|nr:DUF1152 domain-containing protein [Solirubrobacteraceae bacterium]